MCPGIRPATGWIASHIDAALFEEIRQLAHVGAAPARLPSRSPETTTTLRANESCTATSSAVVARTVRPSSARACPTPRTPWPNAPKSTLEMDRFIAFAISSVSKVPEAPTSIPATMSTVESSTKPVADAARPVNAFRSEITTGHVRAADRKHEHHAEHQRKKDERDDRPLRSSPATIATPSAAAAPTITTFTTFWPGNTIGRPLTSS